MADLTIIFASAHKAPEHFIGRVLERLYEAAKDYPVHEIHDRPEDSSIVNYYRQLLATAKQLTTAYLAFAEDDTLYSDEHFNYRPPQDSFGYNFNRWNIQAWSEPPFFYLKQRRILTTLICQRELFIEAFEDKFRADPDGQRLRWWGEPGRVSHEQGLGIRRRQAVDFQTYNPLVVFDHPGAFSHEQGRKRAERIRALEIPYHGRASDIIKLYK